MLEQNARASRPRVAIAFRERRSYSAEALEVAQRLLAKGKEVAIEGKLIPKSYEDGEGNRRYVTQVKVDQFLLFGKKDA